MGSYDISTRFGHRIQGWVLVKFTDTYDEIPSSDIDDVFSAEPIIPDVLYCTKNHKGNAGLILRMQSIESSFNPYFSEALDIQFREKCKIQSNGNPQYFGALSIQSKIPEMEIVMSMFAEIIIEQEFLKSENQGQLFEYLNDLIQLFTFKHPDEFPLNLALGLWGELKLIEAIPSLWRFWRGTEGTTFDFQDKGISLEVKTSLMGRQFTIMSKQFVPNSIFSFLLAYDVGIDYDHGQSVSELVSSVVGKIPPDDALIFSRTLASRGFVFGTNHNNLHKPFKQCNDSPIIIDLNNFDKSLETIIQLISKNIENNLLNKVKMSFNSSQLQQLSNMNLDQLKQETESLI